MSTAPQQHRLICKSAGKITLHFALGTTCSLQCLAHGLPVSTIPTEAVISLEDSACPTGQLLHHSESQDRVKLWHIMSTPDSLHKANQCRHQTSFSESIAPSGLHQPHHVNASPSSLQVEGRGLPHMPDQCACRMQCLNINHNGSIYDLAG